MTETFAVGLVGETNAGWLVEAACTTHAIDIVQETVPRARKVPRRELLVWRANYYRERQPRRRFVPGFVDAPLTTPRKCYGCDATGELIDRAALNLALDGKRRALCRA